MKLRSILFPWLCFISMTVSGQIEVHDNGKISLGGNIVGRPSCFTFINGSSSLLNTLEIFHNNFGANTEGISTQVVTPTNVSYEMHLNNNAGVFYVDGMGNIFYSGGWLTSDSTAKTNLIRLTTALERIKMLNGYSYKYKAFTVTSGVDSGKTWQPDTATHEGLLAQDVKKIAPYMVRKMANGKDAIDYIQIIPILVESIKELDKTQADMSDEITMLQSRLNRLNDIIDTATGKINSSSTLISTDFVLYQNSPNPFTSETTISYKLGASFSNAYIYIMDLQGNLKKTYTLAPNSNQLTLKGSELTPGMYLYMLSVDNKEIDTKRMFLTK